MIKSENGTKEMAVQAREDNIRVSDDEGVDITYANMHIAGPRNLVCALAVFLVASCVQLIAGFWGPNDVPTRFAYPFRHFYNWPAWFCFGTLQSALIVLSTVLIIRFFKLKFISVHFEANRFPTAVICCVVFALFGISAVGQGALRMVIERGW